MADDSLELLFEQWSNAACCGYFIAACRTLNLDPDTIDNILSRIKMGFNQISLDEAKNIYNNY